MIRLSRSRLFTVSFLSPSSSDRSPGSETWWEGRATSSPTHLIHHPCRMGHESWVFTSLSEWHHEYPKVVSRDKYKGLVRLVIRNDDNPSTPLPPWFYWRGLGWGPGRLRKEESPNGVLSGRLVRNGPWGTPSPPTFSFTSLFVTPPPVTSQVGNDTGVGVWTVFRDGRSRGCFGWKRSPRT